jgi:phospholipid-binding lipoprotein MlaA
MRGARGSFTWAIAAALPLLLGACASMPRDAALPLDDPHERTNRYVMSMNQEALRPASEFVKTAIPGPAHDRIHDFNSNLKDPRIFVNNVLQGRPDAAVKTAVRFAVNSTLGVAGLIDVATRAGIPQQSGDFGQTMFVWGVPEGSYVVMPYMGPATTRDAVGSVVDMVTNPVSLVLGPAASIAFGPTTTVAVGSASIGSAGLTMTVGSAGLDAADRLGDFKTAEDASIDFYSFIRASYYQMRRAELRDALGLPPAVETMVLDDPDAGPATAAAPAPEKTRSASAPAAKRTASAPAVKRAASAPRPHAAGTAASGPGSASSASAAVDVR